MSSIALTASSCMSGIHDLVDGGVPQRLGNIEVSSSFLDEYGYIKKAICKSRFNRRLHPIDPCLWKTLFDILAEVLKQSSADQSYVVDFLPVAVCDNIRIRRCRLYPPRSSG